MNMYQHLDPDYQERVLQKWNGVIDAGGEIASNQTKIATAMMLENTKVELDKKSPLKSINEAYSDGMGANIAGTDGGGALGTAFDYGTNDARVPSIVIPTVRRIFPELLAHQVCGVQPMSGPIGFAFAFRALYGPNGKGTVAENVEIGYNSIDSAFTGASGLAITGSNAYWQAFAGSGSATSEGVNAYGEDGQAASLTDSEWWKVGTDMPMAKFKMLKGMVEAKARKLAAHWSLELAEDMANMHGVNVDNEMVNITSYEIQAEIDRQLLSEMVKASINGSRYSSWSPVSADGRNQLERIGTLYTHVLNKANSIAITSRRGPANFAISSPTVCAMFERLQAFTLDQTPNKVDTNGIGVSRVGTLRNNNMNLFRDTFAMGNYILLGYKGPNVYDAGIIFCPYIPIQLMRTIDANDFTPKIGVRTRYGILSHLFGAENYYHFIKVDGLTSSALAADGGRLFMY